MNTCIVSRRVKIFRSSILNEDILERELTITGDNSEFCNREDMICFKKTSSYYLLPRMYGLNYIKEHGLEYKHVLGTGDKINVLFKGNLRENQIDVINNAVCRLREEEGIILGLYCGWGKTVGGLSISCMMGVKTLILVHTKALAIQWKERIESFIDGASVGTIRQDVFDIENRTHVIASMQTICKRDFDSKAFDSFGLTIADEVHRAGSAELSKCIQKAGSRYRLGLSATIWRKDGFTPFLFHAIGPLSSSVERSKKSQELNVEVVEITDGPCEVRKLWRAGKESLNLARMINDISESMTRTRCIINTIIQKYKEGRHILVISDRRNHIKVMSEMIDNEKITDYGFLLGGMKDSEIINASSHKIIFATYAYCAEGVDIASLDTLLLCTPRKDIVQVTGRILRKHSSKKTPLVVDFVDRQSVFKNQSTSRIRYYKTLGGKVIHLNQDLTIKKKCKKRKVEDVDEEKSSMIINFFK